MEFGSSMLWYMENKMLYITGLLMGLARKKPPRQAEAKLTLLLGYIVLRK